MDETVSAERVARLWDRYVEVSRRYLMVKRATDVAEAECTAATNACEAAYANEVQCGLPCRTHCGNFRLHRMSCFWLRSALHRAKSRSD